MAEPLLVPLIAALLISSLVCGESVPTHQLSPSNPYQGLADLQNLVNFYSAATSGQLVRLQHDLKKLEGGRIMQHMKEVMIEGRLGQRNISSTCSDQTVHVLTNLGSGWGMKVLDSWGKPETGILQGNLNWLGQYQQCLNISVPWNKTLPDSLNFHLQYSTFSTHLHLAGQSARLQMGVCMPSGCSNTSIIALFQSAMSPFINTTDFNVIRQVTERNLDAAAWVALIIVGVVAILCLLATLLDISYLWSDKKMTPIISGLPVNSPDVKQESIEASESTPLVVSTPDRKQGLAQKALLCFSLYSNSLKILSTDQPKGSLRCLHGIRFLSMTWVILGHTGAFSVLSVKNPLQVYNWLYRRSFQVILNATVSVDSFFVLSGLLTAYVFLRDFEKRQTTVKVFFRGLPKLFLHRYVRLTPAYAFAVMIWTCLVWYVNDGPIWPNEGTMDQRCQRHWYFNFLYVNNLFQSDDNCFGWSWYLANDMQFFLVAPFLVYLMFRKFFMGLVLMLITIITSVCAGIGVAYYQQAGIGLNVLIPDVKTGTIYYYYAPWCRFHSYGVGLLTGYIIWRLKCKLPISKTWNFLFLAISAGLCLSYLYGPYNLETSTSQDLIQRAIYSSLGRLSFTLGLAYMIIACCADQGGIINKILSWPAFIPVSKLTYCAYLLHPIVIWIIVRGTKSTTNYYTLQYVCTFMTYCSLAFLVAFPFSVLFEAPIMALDKLILSPPSKRTG